MSKLDMDMTSDPIEFDEAVDEFSKRRIISRQEADELEGYARRRAFWISGVAQMDVVNDAQQSIIEAMKNGTPFEEWKKEFGPKLESAWGRSDSARIQTIYRNATNQAYNAGRWDQMREPHIMAGREFWMLDVVDDLRTCEFCGQFVSPPVVLLATDPWWLTHCPPFHHQDRCGIRSLRRTVAEKIGVSSQAPTVIVPDGWGYAPQDAEPPKPSERAKPPDPDTQLENAKKGGKDLRERKPVTIPKKSIEAKARQGKIVSGVHVEEIDGVSSISVGYEGKKPTAKAVKNALSALNTDELALLKIQPLQAIGINEEAIDGKALGMCGGVRTADHKLKYPAGHPSGFIIVAVARNASEYGTKLVPGKIFSVSCAAETAEESVRDAFVHEFAHLLHFRAKDEVYFGVKEDFKKGNPISVYAKTNEYEYFAESYLAYRKHPEALKSFDPVGYAMVQRICRYYGIR